MRSLASTNPGPRSAPHMCTALGLASRSSYRQSMRLGIVDVEGHDLGRAALLHLDRPEATEGADVEAAPAAQSLRPCELLGDAAQVEVARGGRTVGELEGVIPGSVSNSRVGHEAGKYA